jgi:hypothetical protein
MLTVMFAPPSLSGFMTQKFAGSPAASAAWRRAAVPNRPAVAFDDAGEKMFGLNCASGSMNVELVKFADV